MKKIKYILVLFLILGCQAEDEDGWAPVARLDITPAYVNINEMTEVVLDGRKSCDPLDRPDLCDTTEDGDGAPSTCPGGITYEWDVPSMVGSIISSSPNGSLITVNVFLDRPEKISLTVTDCDGLSATKSVYLGITSP
jgi:hypothetical protein